MSAQAFFDAARALKRELTADDSIGLMQAEVDALNAIISKWVPATPLLNPTALGDAQAFYKAVREKLGGLSQQQVDGFNALLQAMGAARWPLAWAAYGLATAWHETAQKMQPVEEAFWKDDAWRRENLRYYPWHGRGYVQLTWERNYQRADEELGLGGRLLANPKLAFDPQIAAKIMVCGMEQGWFTTKRLADYLPLSGQAGFDAYRAARRIINGQDKAAEIAKLAQCFEAALAEGGWR